MYRREHQQENAAALGVDPEVFRSDAVFSDGGFFGGLGIRVVRLDLVGNVHQGHCHSFDHVTVIASGRVRCEIKGRDAVVYAAPSTINIAAHEWHRFTALENGTLFYCIFAAKDGGSMSGPGTTRDDVERNFIGCGACKP